MSKQIIFLALILHGFCGYAQNFAEVHIIVKHKKSDKYVDGATVVIQPIEKTFETDKKGLIKVGLPISYYRFEVSVPASETIVRELEINSDTTLFFIIEGDYLLLEDVKIFENQVDDRIGTNIMSIEKIDSKQLERIPVIAGERDLLKAAAYMPGIQTGSEGSSDLLVRGGTPDQNLYLLDGARLYHSNHLYGFLSSFNPLIVSELDIYKGGFPPRFGGKLSSIIDAKTLSPNYNNFEGETTLGLISTSILLNLPILSDKINLMIGGRRSYYDSFVRLFGDNDNAELYNFHDLNIKLNGRINEQNEISFSIYQDRDLFRDINNKSETYESAELKRKWNNKIYSIRWTGVTGILDNDFNLYYSKFNTSITDKKDHQFEFYNTRFSSYIKDYRLNYRVGIRFSETVHPYIGLDIAKLEIMGADIAYQDQDTILTNSTLPKKELLEHNLFGGIELNLHDRWKANLGARLSSVKFDSTSSFIPEPRASFTYSPTSFNSIKLSYSKMSQTLHMLTNPGLGMPINIYVPVRNNFVPEISHQVALGYIQNFEWQESKWDFNTEIYYKKMSNILEYRDGYSSHVFTSPLSQTNDDLEDIITTGQGISYGAEFFIRRNTGRFLGFASYTLSWTKHQFNELNNGEFFPARHDIRHNLVLNGSYKLNDKWQINVSWQYKTGQAITLPLQTYPAPKFTLVNGAIRPYDGVLTALYANSKRNEYRMKAFHVLNISAQKAFTWKRKIKGVLEFGLYNTYNRKNPYYYYQSNSIQSFADDMSDYKINSSIRSVSIFPVVPSFSIKIKF